MNKTILTIEKTTLIIGVCFMIFSCGNKAKKSDAYGNFETDKITISAEANGKILDLQLEEGDILKQDQQVGLIDTLNLFYQKEQLKAQRNSILANFEQIDAQVEVQKQQLENIKTSQERIKKLYAKGAATRKQLDDIQGKFDITRKEISAIESQRNSLQQQINSIDKHIDQIELAIYKCHIICPTNGTVLNKLSIKGEMITLGRPIFTIADLSSLKLKAYISESQLSTIKIGQKVDVLIDSKEGLKTLSGKLIWISESSEFTPKTIQTREERINLVYAIKVKVVNDGSLKIGMPAEVIFSNNDR